LSLFFIFKRKRLHKILHARGIGHCSPGPANLPGAHIYKKIIFRCCVPVNIRRHHCRLTFWINVKCRMRNGNQCTKYNNAVIYARLSCHTYIRNSSLYTVLYILLSVFYLLHYASCYYQQLYLFNV